MQISIELSRTLLASILTKRIRGQNVMEEVHLTREMDSVTPTGYFHFIFPQEVDCTTWYQNRNKIIPRPESFIL